MDDHNNPNSNPKTPPKLTLVPTTPTPSLRPRHDGFTDDKRAAFLAALKEDGQVVLAAKAAGVTVQAAYYARGNMPDFAQAWAEALADYKPDEKALRGRHDGFSPDKRRIFLEVLKETGCVSDAAKLAGVSVNTANRTRKMLPDFARAWNIALAMASTTIDIIAFERATVGAEKKIIRDGNVVQIEQKPSDTILRTIMMNTARAKERAADADEKAAASADVLSPKERKMAREAALRRIRFEVGQEEQARIKTQLIETIMERFDKLDRHSLAQGYTRGPDGSLVPPGWRMVPVEPEPPVRE